MSNTLADISKTVAISSIGLYAGILTCSATITTFTPLDVVKGRLIHVWCAFGTAGSVLAAASSAAFGLNYYLSPENARDTLSLFGSLVGPLTGAMIYASTLIKCGTKPKKQENPQLPPNHPSVVGENGEIKQCPFGKGKSEENSNSNSSSECQSSLCSPINVNLMIVSTISICTFVKVVCSTVRSH